jgi:hypothetical protein
MIRWDLEHADLWMQIILNNRKMVIESFRPADFQVMYKLSNLKIVYNNEFLEKFNQEECV